MKIAVAQLNYHIGNFEGNLAKMQDAVHWAKGEGADLICFSELSTCGYPPRDFLEFDDFIKKCEESIDALRLMSRDIAIVVGSPSCNPVPEGKDLYNSCYFLYNEKILGIQHKALLPTYDIFDEYRYFEKATEFNVVEFKGKKIALTICEDIWDVPEGPNNRGVSNPLYTVVPLDEVMDQNPDFILNISASPFSASKANTRLDIVQGNVERYGIPMIYVNHCGAQTEVVFDGGSLVVASDAQVYDELPYFKEARNIYELGALTKGRPEKKQERHRIQLMREAIVLGIKDYFGKLGFKKAIMGLSGGIDSALTAALTVEALGPENVHGILMPSDFSSNHSVEDARQLAINLGMSYDIIPIKSKYEEFLTTLEPHFEGRPFNVTEENLQARIRGVLLMAFSNKLGYILLNTTNKSEMAVGYGTLYGDLCGGLSVLGDVYKTDVYKMARAINEDGIKIPVNSIEKPPSAELRPNQKDSDSLPDYDILDEILLQYIEDRKGPEEIIANGHDPALVRRILRLVNINEFKRYQTAPVLRVSSKSFGQGRRMPIVAKYLN